VVLGVSRSDVFVYRLHSRVEVVGTMIEDPETIAEALRIGIMGGFVFGVILGFVIGIVVERKYDK